MFGVISDNTSITIGLAVVIVGAVFWLSKMYSLGKQNEKEITRIWIEIELFKTNNNLNIDRMARIETKLDAVLDFIKKNS